MSFFMCEKIFRFSLIRAILLCVLGFVVLLFPDILVNAIVYIIAAYLIMIGILSFIHDFYTKETLTIVINFVGCIFIIIGVFSIIYFRYVVSILPVFLGGLLIIEGIYYFIIALCYGKSGYGILIVLSVMIFIGGGIVGLITFGGLLTLSKIFGTLLLLSCLYEVIAYIIFHKARKV